MRVLMCTFGTWGDIEPFIALGQALKARGHQATLGCDRFYREPVLAAGMEWHEVGETSAGTIAEVMAQVRSTTDLGERVQVLQSAWLLPQFMRMTAAVLKGCETHDFLVIYPFQLAAVFAAGMVGIPKAVVLIDPVPERLLARHEPVDCLQINAMHRPLVDPDAKWPPEYQYTGAWFRPEESDWRPSSELTAFLEAGSAPLLISMGSMDTFDRAAFVRLYEQALTLAGMRAIVVSGWAGLERHGSKGRSDILQIPFAPYSWLMPRCGAVLHHGGSGTTAAALRAGLPSVLFPQLLPQAMWRELLERQGVLGGSLSSVEMPPAALAAMLRHAMDDEGLARRCRRMAAAVQADPGVQRAVHLIEMWHGRVPAIAHGPTATGAEAARHG